MADSFARLNGFVPAPMGLRQWTVVVAVFGVVATIDPVVAATALGSWLLLVVVLFGGTAIATAVRRLHGTD